MDARKIHFELIKKTNFQGTNAQYDALTYPTSKTQEALTKGKSDFESHLSVTTHRKLDYTYVEEKKKWEEELNNLPACLFESKT